MTKGFQQQDTGGGFIVPKTAPRPQHGQPAEKKEVEIREPRAFKPRPGR